MGNPYGKILCGGEHVISLKNEGPFSSTPHTLSEKYYAGCWRNVHFRHGISFCTPGSALEKNASDIMLLLCGDYAGISDADLSFLRDPGLCGEHPGVISYILCTGVDGFFLLLCGVEAKRTPPRLRAHDNSSTDLIIRHSYQKPQKKLVKLVRFLGI